jgi:hypothetical protein
MGSNRLDRRNVVGEAKARRYAPASNTGTLPRRGHWPLSITRLTHLSFITLTILKSKNAPVIPTWDPEEQYDPMRPNDYFEFKAWKQKEREEARAKREEQRRMELKRTRRSSSYTGSSGSESDEGRFSWRGRKAGESPILLWLGLAWS